MQSMGHGGRHKPQPVHRAAITLCMVLAAPTMASVGQAGVHSAQPMHSASTMRATERGIGAGTPAANGLAGARNALASSCTVTSPPGGQRFKSARPAAMASA